LKVLLKQNVDRLGRMGEVVDVAGGYARNYLIPFGIAIGVTRGHVKEIEEQKKVLEVRAARERESMEAVSEKIRSRPIMVEARCSTTGKLFGSVTKRQLAQAVGELVGEEIDRHKITMDERIREVGAYKASIRLHPDVAVDIEFEVQGEGFVPEEPPAEAEEGDTGELQDVSAGEATGTGNLATGGDTGEDEWPEGDGGDVSGGAETEIVPGTGSGESEEPGGGNSESRDDDVERDPESRRE
jgi:large subunit ribosomal protein L9